MKSLIGLLVLLLASVACASSLWQPVPVVGDTFSGNAKLVWVVDPSDIKTLEFSQIKDQILLGVELQQTEVYGIGTVLMIKLPVPATTSAYGSIWMTRIGDEPRQVVFYISGSYAHVALPRGQFERSTLDLRGQISYHAAQ